jgi:hypothetical protein
VLNLKESKQEHVAAQEALLAKLMMVSGPIEMVSRSKISQNGLSRLDLK